jgi:hypothetical protein
MLVQVVELVLLLVMLKTTFLLLVKSEVRRSRDMHWLRIDRYYSSEETFEGDNEKKIAGLSIFLHLMKWKIHQIIHR